MDIQALYKTVDLISVHGYLFIFIVMVIEGPIVTAAAAFASAIGIFDVYLIFLLSVFANLLADAFYYLLGFWGREKVIEKYGKRFGFGKEKVEKIERLLTENAWATIAAIKIAPGLATPGLIVVGASRMHLSKFIKINLYMTLPLCLFFVVLGYYAGLANALADKYIHHSQYWLLLGAVAIVLGSIVYKKVSQAIARKIEKI